MARTQAETAAKTSAAGYATNIQPAAKKSTDCYLVSLVSLAQTQGANQPLSRQERWEAHTLPFLAALGGADAQYLFATFDDNKIRKDPGLTRQFFGTFAQHGNALEALNAKGAGVFVTVNQTDGRGRKKENIKALRGFYADFDLKGAQEPFCVDSLPLEPTIVVRSGGGGAHGYWRFTKPVPCCDVSKLDFEQGLKRISGALAKYGADPKVCDCTRVLRLPGFLHKKNIPALVSLGTANGPRYASNAILQHFPAIEPQLFMAEATAKTRVPRPAVPSNDVAASPCNFVTKDNYQRILNYVKRLPAAIEGHNGSTTCFNAALKLMSKFSLSESEAYDLMAREYNNRCCPPWSDAELWHKVKSAANYARRQQ